MNATTLRNGLAILLLIGGVVRLASAAAPERAPVVSAPASSGHACKLGASC